MTKVGRELVRFLITFAVLGAFTAISQAQTLGDGSNKVINKNPLQASARFNPQRIPPGANAELIVELNLAPKHHAYLDQFKLTVLQPKDMPLAQFELSPIKEFKDPFSTDKKIRKAMGEGKATMRTIAEVPVAHPPGDHSAIIEVRYQACTDDYCLFPKTTKATAFFTVPGDPSNPPVTADTSSEDSFFDFSQDSFDQALDEGGLTVFVLVFLAGLLTAFTPCIFPMIPITLAVLGARSEHHGRLQNFLLALFYVLGIAITYSLLGLFVASTGMLFGSLLGNPWVVGFLALIFVAMALSMFGLYEIQAPAFIRNSLALHKTQGGVVGAFIAGAVAGIVASPCVGPVLIAILTYVAQSQDTTFGFFLLFTFAFGMGQPFLALGTFSHLKDKLPKAGPWMNFTKYIFGIAMLALAAWYIYPVLPKNLFQDTPQQTQSEAVYEGEWQEYTDQKLQAALDAGQPVIIDFYADWCVACKELEEFTFTAPEVEPLMKKFVLLRFDATTPDEKFQKLSDKYKILGLPMVIFYDVDGEWRKDLTLTGFEKAEKFRKRIEKAL